MMFAFNTQPIVLRRRSRPSFTLVELMIVIAIIGIMGSMLLYALAGAQRDALVARTQGTLKKINDIVLYKWEEFRYRSVKVNIPDDYLYRLTIGPQAGQAPVSPREAARLRLMVLRDTMRMELPDQYLDLEYAPTMYHAAVFTDSGSPSVITPPIVRTVPGEYNNLRRSFGLPPVVNP
jgi:prepilin-type N-terminal cleavage/methylation domain-containing protein